MSKLSVWELREIDEGFQDIKAGRVKSAKEVTKELEY
jgi:predicted transcriptional regulator